MTYIGIDPGKSGGVAFITDDGNVTAVKMPETEHHLWLLLASHDGAVAVIEKVGATPQMGVVSSFSFGRSVGTLHMAAVAAGLQVNVVTPQRWQKTFGLIVKGKKLGRDDVSKKNRNKALAQELFPHLKVTHAIADALLLAEYGRRQKL